ncbi:MAG: flippase [Bacteroidota bacterium]
MAKNYFFNLLLTLTNLLFPILSFPYVSRILGPEGIGKVQFVFSFAQYFALIASLGIPIYGMKEIARYKDNPDGRSRVFSELISIYILTCISLSVIYLIVIYSFPYFIVNREMYLGAMFLILLGFTNIEWLYSGMEEFRAIALRSVAFKIIGLILLYLLIKERSDFKIYLYLLMFSYLGNNILSLFLLKNKVRFIFSGLKLKKHLTPLLLILGTTLAASMYTDMDTVLLGFLSDEKTVGLYTAAVKLSKISIPFVISLNFILLPKIGKDFADENMDGVKETLSKAFRFIMFFAVPVVFGLAVLAPEFIALFSGKEFLPATNSMRLLSVLPLIIGFAHFLLFMILVPSGHNKEMFMCVLGGVVVSVVLNICLVPFYKEVGSAVANVSAELVVTALYFYFIKKYFSFNYEWKLLAQAVISAILFIPLVWFIKQMSLQLVYTLLLSVISCAIIYISIQLFLFSNNFVYDIVGFIRLKLVKQNKQ